MHENTRPHTTVRKRALFEQFGCQTFAHPPYSLDKAPRDYPLFPYLKRYAGDQNVQRDQETKDVVQEWLNGLAWNLCNEGMQQLVSRYENASLKKGIYSSWQNVLAIRFSVRKIS